jgi:ABC-2 type transport system permease protein
VRSRALQFAAAMPVAMRIGLAEAVAYRAEFIVWFLAYSMPLIMMALWTAVAREAPVGRFDQAAFKAYFMVTLIVRLVTGSWVAWELTMEVRSGSLGQRMLRPFPPLLAHFCSNASAMPLRTVLTLPVLVITVLWLGPGIFTSDPVQLALVPLSIVGSFAILFLISAMIGTLSLFWESALSIMDLWFALYMVLSGYVVPLELFPESVRGVLTWLPFRSLLAFPVENALGMMDRGTSLEALAIQWGWVAVAFAACALTWRAGARRFAAFGG